MADSDRVVGALRDLRKPLHRDARILFDAAREARELTGHAQLLLPLLYGLYDLHGGIQLHLEGQDAAYLALLDDHLSESQARVIVGNLERTTWQQGAPTRA